MTSERYNARESEPRWQRQWDQKAIFASRNDDPRPKYYVLEMFPYPSGRIHIGHVRNYTLGDVLARFMRAKGFNVLHPMGWDAFGLPAENAAIERKVAPKAWTYDNIAAMKKQLQSIGLSLDWSREFATCDPAYYKHQQKMFLDFLRAGLAEREKRKLNWDPVDMTVLANEQVIDGRGWRSGAVVEQREMNQWVFKITKYSQELLDALDTLDRWPDKVRLMQRNWIGRSEGMLVRFALDQATTPSGETVATVGRVLDQTIGRPVRTFPAESCGVALACVVCPGVRVAVGKNTVIEAATPRLDATAVSAVLPSDDARTVAEPMLRPVTAPVELTATIELSDDVQTTARSARTLPAESLRVAASLVPLPTFTFACDGLIAIDATGTGTTVTVELLRFPPTSKVIVVVPRAEACTRPVEDTGAIDVEFEVQCVAVGLRSETVSPDLSSTEYEN
jgi:hypothetical protein